MSPMSHYILERLKVPLPLQTLQKRWGRVFIKHQTSRDHMVHELRVVPWLEALGKRLREVESQVASNVEQLKTQRAVDENSKPEAGTSHGATVIGSRGVVAAQFVCAQCFLSFSNLRTLKRHWKGMPLCRHCRHELGS